MSEFQGLHNPDQHRPGSDRVTAWCDCGRFGVQCTTDYPCRCCLAVEVERLTALLKAADDVVASQDRRIDAAIEALGHELPESTGYMRDEFAAGQNYLRANVLEALRGTDG